MSPARSEAAFPGVNGKIAFVSDRDGGDEDIFVMGADGSAPTNLTADSAGSRFDTQPAFSPDGARISFSSNRAIGGVNDIFVMGADGSDPTNLTNNMANDIQPDFSPDGARIAFVSDREGGDSDVFVMGADGSSPVNLTSDSAANDRHATFSPDGSQIAFSSDREGGADDEIFVMGSDGSAPTNLTNADAADDFHPDFSPDGSRIAFERDEDIFVMGADGSGQANLTSASPAFDTRPAFSPDGSQIAFSSTPEGGEADIFAMGADGSNPTNLTSDSAASDDDPAWQPLNPPLFDLSAKPKQRSVRFVSVTAISQDEAATATIAGTLKAPKVPKRGAVAAKAKLFELTPVTVELQPGQPAALKLAIPRKARKLLKTAFEVGRKGKVVLTGTATDVVGASSEDTQRVKLKRKKRK